MISKIKRTLLFLMVGLTSCASGAKLKAKFAGAETRPEYRKAMDSYDAGDYALAAAQFESVMDRLPSETPERAEAIFFQGRAYYYLKEFARARESFRRYRDEYPAGKHQSEAAQDLLKIAAETATPNLVAEDKLKEARSDLNTLAALEKDHPNDPKIKYYLGNAHYELGDYQKAGQYYFTAQAIESAYKQKELIRDRLFINARGEPEALTPETLRALELERNPLAAFDQMTYYQRNDENPFSAKQIYYAVTGKIRNQGSKPVKNAKIEARFLNAVNEVLDTQTIQIGSLAPGEIRPFLARAANYDALLNIAHVEIFPRAE
ncbi:tetratricopeptide repeat protein [Candidatus Sumerlaeota bacterium]|nr:tetratricopeptide repeat protein [Candidatus Sumerlaeota bacterium]